MGAFSGDTSYYVPVNKCWHLPFTEQGLELDL